MKVWICRPGSVFATSTWGIWRRVGQSVFTIWLADQHWRQSYLDGASTYFCTQGTEYLQQVTQNTQFQLASDFIFYRWSKDRLGAVVPAGRSRLWPKRWCSQQEASWGQRGQGRLHCRWHCYSHRMPRNYVPCQVHQASLAHVCQSNALHSGMPVIMSPARCIRQVWHMYASPMRSTREWTQWKEKLSVKRSGCLLITL